MNDAESPVGETTCFLAELDAQGGVPDPRSLIRLGDARASTPAAWRVLVSQERHEGSAHDEWAPELAARSTETLQEYRARLLQPVCRTKAWQLALRTEVQQVEIVMPAGASADFAAELVTYLRQLIS